MIRIAIADDESAIVRLVRQAWTEHPLGDIEEDEDVIRKNVRSAIKSPLVYMRVIDIDGEIHGVIAGTIVPAMNFRGDVATDIITYVKPEYRGKGLALLRGFMKWAFGFTSVRYVALGISSGDSKTEELYQRLKFQRLGATFIARRKT
jgi:GNAT superfamily N-acetyltransferase